MKVYSNDDYQGVTLNGAVIEAATINSPSITGTASSTGPVLADTLIISNIIVEKGWSFTFSAAAANQKIDLYCTSTAGLESLMDVMVATNTGAVSRRYSLQKQGTGIIQSGSRYNEVIGQVSPYLAISDIVWDVTAQRWRFQIVNRAPLGTTLTGSITIRLIAATATAQTLISTFGVGSVYTTDTSTLPEPVFQFAGAIQADALITNFVKKGVNYTLTPVDSILICTAGIVVTLPVASVVGIGRSYTIKNIQNAGVSVKPATTASKLDNSISVFTVGNGKTITVTCDGVDWWITSAY